MPDKKVYIHNLSNDMVYTYININPVDALINQAIINDGKSTSIHNPMIRDGYRIRIINAIHSLSIGDLAVLKEK